MGKQTLFVPGPIPRLNEFVGRDPWYWRNAKKEWLELIGWEIRRQNLRPMTRVSIQWIWQERDMRQDPDNFSGIGKKFILDALVEMGILKNDGWKQIVSPWSDSWLIVPESPGVTVILEEQES